MERRGGKRAGTGREQYTKKILAWRGRKLSPIFNTFFFYKNKIYLPIYYISVQEGYQQRYSNTNLYFPRL